MSRPSIIYMGTPKFAVMPLQLLIDNNYDIKAVVTSCDKPAGRGQNIQISEIKKFAIDNKLNILQPKNLKSTDFIEQLNNLNADIFVVVAFRMLPKEVWKLPKLGTINLHASLLPNYRGAAPINHAIINGESKTGLTTFFINENIDEGDIIKQIECNIDIDDNAETLHDKMQIIGSQLLVETIEDIFKNKIITKVQNFDNENIKLAPKIDKQFCRINFNDNAVNVYNKIRGLSPYPTAWFTLNNDKDICKVYKSKYIIEKTDCKTGTILSDNKTFIKIACLDGFIFIEELQLSGKKKMLTKDFLNGYKFN